MKKVTDKDCRIIVQMIMDGKLIVALFKSNGKALLLDVNSASINGPSIQLNVNEYEG